MIIYLCRDFELFINPYDVDEFIKSYKYIHHKDLEYCDYVIYLACPTINGELDGSFKVIRRCDIEDIIYDDYCVLAVNYIDGIVLEVIGGCL